jgi:hypothetical protein
MIKNENSVTLLPQWVVDEMVSYLYANGMVMKTKDLTGVCHVPVVVLPTPVKIKLIFLGSKVVVRKN